MNLQNVLDILDALEKVSTILAIVIGGLWAYYQFFRGRTYRPRLETQVVGQIFDDLRHYHLLVSSKLKNVGLSKVDLDRDASGVRIYSCVVPADITEIESAQWDHIATFPVFENHRWIESGETIEDEILLSIEKGTHRAFRAVLRVVGRKISWKAERIISARLNEPDQAEQNEVPKTEA